MATTFVKTTFSNSASTGSKNGKSHVAPAGLQGGSDRAGGRVISLNQSFNLINDFRERKVL